MGCVSDKPKPQNDNKKEPRIVPSGGQQNSNIAPATGQPQSNNVSGSNVQGQPEHTSNVKADDPYKSRDPQGSGVREANNNPYGSNVKNQENPAVGTSGVHASGMANTGEVGGNHHSGIQNQPYQNGNASGIRGQNPQAVGGSNLYGGNSGIQNENPYATNQSGREGANQPQPQPQESNPYGYSSGLKESKNDTLLRFVAEGKEDVPEQQIVPVEGHIQTEGYLWNSGLLKIQ